MAQYIDPITGKVGQKRPPVIPEIAKAYQNDPRTQLAMTALANGGSTAPVAGGKWAMADGVARMLQGIGGAYINKKQMAGYRGEEDQLRLERQKAGTDGLTGLPTTPAAAPVPAPTAPPPMPAAAGSPAAPVAPPVPMANPGAAAERLTGQPAPMPGGMPPPGPPGGLPMPPAGPPGMPPVQGAGPGGQPPFGPGAVAPSAPDPASALKRAVIRLKQGGAHITSGYRSPAHNKDVHGVSNSYHTRGTPDNPLAYDLTPPKGMTMAGLHADAVGLLGPGYDVINEGDHVHVEPKNATMTLATSHPPTSPAALLASAPEPETVPDAPAPVARPKTPDAVGPTRSRLLEYAYKLMAGGNAYESARSQDMLGKGLADQTDLEENYTKRRQDIIDAESATDRGIYATGANADRQAAIQAREAAIARNAARVDKQGDRQFSYGVHREDQADTARENSLNRASALEIAKLREKRAGGSQGGWGLNAEEEDAINQAAGEGRVDAARLNSRTAKIMARIFIANPGFDAMTNHGTAALIGNAPAQQKAMMASMIPHVLENVRDAGKKLNFSDVQFVGKVQAWAKGEFNDPDFTEYMNNRNDAMMTLANVMRGVGATDKATEMENNAAPKSMSPRAWDAYYRGQMKAIIPRVQMYEAKKLVPAGTTDTLRSQLQESSAPAASPVAAYSDAGKEARYQAWKKAHPNGQ